MLFTQQQVDQVRVTSQAATDAARLARRFGLSELTLISGKQASAGREKEHAHINDQAC